MPAPEIIHQLVQQFRENQAEYKSARYNEAQLRHEFLDKFFEALGWDVYNKAGYPLDTRDVMVEDSLEIEGHSKSPDYAFKIGKERKFYVEAKKPHVNIKTDFEPAYQLRRYAWSNHLALSVLTDFEEFSLYDCRERPAHGVNPASSRLLYVHYEEYPERWDEIAAILSKEAVYKGSFDRYVLETKGKRGTTEVDDEFLKDIEEWRKSLALNLALRNADIQNERQLNYAVQMTIDRIIFLRICEDRGIEPEEQLLQLTHAPGIYQGLVRLFKLADTRYNSGLFHFAHESAKKQAGRHSADTFTPDLLIDDKVLKEIIRGLYYPCPYVFKEIPVEILGQVYEQFLGRVIRLTPSHQAKIEEKPEVRKAGGVYYTPKYIVDYIVADTVGKLLEGKTPDQASPLKIVDPACGSGSFLLGAFQYLMDWHEDWYLRHEPEKYARGKEPALIITKDGWRLTTNEKKRILVNNIHGVDIDEQAVEVTKLSLLLKVLEEETGQLSLGFERALPDLGNNIKCGNSLIGSDYFEGQLVRDEREVERVNPFDWRSAFPEVFRQGGFDAVIGNPPYIRIQAMKEWAPGEVEFYKKKYVSASKGNYDIYVVFVEKGLSLINENGVLGFILPHKFFTSQYGEPLRLLISSGNSLSAVVHFRDNQIFENATTYTCLLFLSKGKNDSFTYLKVTDFEKWKNRNSIEAEVIESSQSHQPVWTFLSGQSSDLFTNLRKLPTKLGDISTLFVGLQTDADDIYILEEVKVEFDKVLCFSKATGKEHWFENNHLKPFLKGSKNIRRYYLSDVTKRLIFPYTMINGKSVLIDSKEYKNNFPLTWEYLVLNKQMLTKRNKGRMGADWYGYVYKKNHTKFRFPKLLVPSIASGSCFAEDLEGKYYFVGSGGGGGGGYGISLNSNEESSPYYVLGLLNSSLISSFIKQISTPFRGGYYALNRQYIENIPIRTIDFTNPAEVKLHDRLVSLVKCMLELHKRTPQTPHEKERLDREIASTDAQIDRLVYELYGLTEEEIKIVEGK